MVLPAFALFFTFHTLPVLQGVFYSFTDYAGYGSWEWVGFRNYANLFNNDRITESYIFTFQFAIVTTILVNAVALAIAVGLNAKIKFRTTLRGVFFMPNVLAVLIVGYIFQYMFANSIPYILERLGIGGPFATNILAHPDHAWWGIVIMTTWQSAAFAVILYLAGLQTVPDDVIEAASIDGAGAWRRFWSVTFPIIAPFFTINMVLAGKNLLMVFDQIVALTGGGPGTATESIGLVIYRGGFQGGEFAYQTANAVIFFIVIAAFSICQLRILQRREESA
jgi:raffinose/stachyose/melibiose transport system permease protein